jgi:ribosome biogenesis protein Nip4
MLEAAWNQLKVGGTIIYSTCSLEPEEGEVQIHEFLLKHPDQVELLPLKLDIGLPGNQTYWKEKLNPMLQHSRRIFPELGYDGFFVTLMKKVSEGDDNAEVIQVKDIPSPSRNLKDQIQSRVHLLEKYNNKSKEVRISILSEDEVDNIGRVVSQVIPINEFSQFCANYNFFKLHDRREDVYIIKKEDLMIFDEVIKFLMISPSKLAHLKIKLGFFLKNRFRIGIESLQTLPLPFQKSPFIINDKQAERFIYGKNVEIPIIDENNHVLTISDTSITAVFNKNQIPLGYAKIIKNENQILLKNIIDIGLYLRSEKTAF